MLRSKIAQAATLALFATAPMLAQRFEFGGAGGASLYTKQTVEGRTTSVDVKLKPGFAASAYLGQIGERFGGELRYNFHTNGFEASGNGRTFSIPGRSQSFHYDVHVYFSGKDKKVRPYVFGGGGMKMYQGTGDIVAVQPLMSTVVLTQTTDWKPLITAGGGIRIRASERWHVRAELRVFMTQTPDKIIAPVSGTMSGWLFNLAPTVGISYVW